MTNLFLVRHGETALNTKGVYYGLIDCELTEVGIEQVNNLAARLPRLQFDAILASPLKRALQTAAILSGLNEEQIIIDEGLMELNFGEWEGKAAEEIQATHPDEWQLWANDWRNYPPPGGESFQELEERVRFSLTELLHTYQDKNVLLVSHNSCLRIIMASLLKVGEQGFWNFTFEQGAYSWLEVSDGHCTIRKINC